MSWENIEENIMTFGVFYVMFQSSNGLGQSQLEASRIMIRDLTRCIATFCQRKQKENREGKNRKGKNREGKITRAQT